jgi:hypothetical protein
MLLRLRSLGMFGGGGGAWRATVGASDVVVQVPMVTAGAPTMATPPVGDCSSAPRGSCTAARFAVGEWALAVPAAHAQAITVVDAVGKGVDPGSAASTHGAGWRAVELDRGAGHAAIVVVDPGLTTVTYTAAPGIHVVVGAPAGGSGRAEVTATASGGGCAVTLAARRRLHPGRGSGPARLLAAVGDRSAGRDVDGRGVLPGRAWRVRRGGAARDDRVDAGRATAAAHGRLRSRDRWTAPPTSRADHARAARSEW